jgi:hypothetical protein
LRVREGTAATPGVEVHRVVRVEEEREVETG